CRSPGERNLHGPTAAGPTNPSDRRGAARPLVLEKAAALAAPPGALAARRGGTRLAWRGQARANPDTPAFPLAVAGRSSGRASPVPPRRARSFGQPADGHRDLPSPVGV